MKKLIVLAILLGLIGSLMAKDGVATLDLDLSIPDVTVLSITGGNIDVILPTPHAGDGFVDVTAFSSYEIITNTPALTTQDINAALSVDISATGVVLWLRADAPTTGTSAGAVNISGSATLAVPIVTAIGPTSDTDLQLEFKFVVDALAPSGSEDLVLTLTLADE
ncbi:MAG: hypothetical protein H8E33_01830 [Candidatus Cloacimonetes bacterium]|nr:hypothetical protein [Candidatus Cloacimonadota bacterium]MBL7107762.1 hypothetical protein [Candidatus Cloacimonadota bacterium]